MKTQMRFQKILFLVSLVIAALTIVYAFGFCTGAITYLARVTSAYSNKKDPYGAENVYWLAQDFNDILLWLGIIFVLVIVACYIFASNKRRNYYISNYITVGIAIGYCVVWAIVCIALTATVQVGLSEVDWDGLANWADGSARLYGDNQTIYYLGYVLAVVVLLDAAALAYNLVWKIKLMKGEKELLANGQNVSEVQEVA
ncbi:MAG: hypothetical protein LUD19_06670 [Clostridia bacterium]|nr:hypothetical protein [Clostridia bacterium]